MDLHVALDSNVYFTPRAYLFLEMGSMLSPVQGAPMQDSIGFDPAGCQFCGMPFNVQPHLPPADSV